LRESKGVRKEVDEDGTPEHWRLSPARELKLETVLSARTRAPQKVELRRVEGEAGERAGRGMVRHGDDAMAEDSNVGILGFCCRSLEEKN
jgi:hypothetical protein